MFNLILFGPPGSGKGTQSVRLAQKYGLIHISTGDLLRKEIADKTELGLAAKTVMDRGELVSDEIVIGMIEGQLNANPKAAGFIFDGFPRTVVQAGALDDVLKKHGTLIAVTLSLEVENDELIKRLLLRGQSSGRSDDRDENVISNRIKEYTAKTSPLVEYYKSQSKFHPVVGVGELDVVFKALCLVIDNKLALSASSKVTAASSTAKKVVKKSTARKKTKKVVPVKKKKVSIKKKAKPTVKKKVKPAKKKATKKIGVKKIKSLKRIKVTSKKQSTKKSSVAAKKKNKVSNNKAKSSKSVRKIVRKKGKKR